MRMQQALNKAIHLALLIFISDGIPAGAANHVLQITANSLNVVGNHLLLDSPVLNGKPSQRLIVTQNYTPVGVYNSGVPLAEAETYLDHPVAAGYDPTLRRWYIYIEDDIPIPNGASFNVLVAPAATIVNANTLNSYGSESLFLTERGNSAAFLFLTHRFNPNDTLPGGGGLYVKHLLGLGYDSTASDGPAYKHWYVATEDSTSAEAAAYFVYDATHQRDTDHVNVFLDTPPAGTNTTTVPIGTTSGVIVLNSVGGTPITSPVINGNSNAVIFVTHVLSNGAMFNENVGVYYNGGTWYIINANLSSTTGFSAEPFNVLAFDAPVP